MEAVKPCKKGLCKALIVRIALFPFAAVVFLLPMYFSGASATVFCSVRTGRKQCTTDDTVFRLMPHDFRIQGFIYRKYGIDEPLAHKGIRNTLDTDTFIPIFQYDTFPIVIVTTGGTD